MKPLTRNDRIGGVEASRPGDLGWQFPEVVEYELGPSPPGAVLYIRTGQAEVAEWFRRLLATRGDDLDEVRFDLRMTFTNGRSVDVVGQALDLVEEKHRLLFVLGVARERSLVQLVRELDF